MKNRKRTTKTPKPGVAAVVTERARGAAGELMKLRDGLSVGGARQLAEDVSERVAKETRRLRRDLGVRATALSRRVDRERKSVMHRVDAAVKSTLASLNIPTRTEIQQLARRVEELSRKVDALRRR